jgi:NADH-quinone oxidoreductase subunit J
MSHMGTVFFAICAAIAVLSAFGTISSRTPIRAALSLLAHILSLAGLYLTLHAHLLAAMQLIVYAGAVVVLFVFVIMLIGPTQEEHAKPGLRGATPRILSIFLMASVALSVASAVGGFTPDAPEIAGCDAGVTECAQFGGVKGVARVLYVDAVVPFELVSILLLVAILGAIVVARGRTQREAEKHKAERVARDAADAAQRDYEQKLSAEVSAHGGH